MQKILWRPARRIIKDLMKDYSGPETLAQVPPDKK
jgi:hypothetical protein